MNKKFYSYYIESTKENGILDNWSDCQKKVLGTKSSYKSFKTYEEAKSWLDNLLNPNEKNISSTKTNSKFYACFYVENKSYKIFDNWAQCKKEIENNQCRYKSFKTYEEAKNWLEDGAIYQTKALIEKTLIDGIYFDAGTGRGIGVEAKVSFKNGVSILKEYFPNDNINKFGNLSLGFEKTNNFGELKALDMALDIALKENILNIFGDSTLIINYWSKGIIKSDINSETIELSKIVSHKRKEFEKIGGTISHISGDINPADLGFHK